MDFFSQAMVSALSAQAVLISTMTEQQTSSWETPLAPLMARLASSLGETPLFHHHQPLTQQTQYRWRQAKEENFN